VHAELMVSMSSPVQRHRLKKISEIPSLTDMKKIACYSCVRK